MKAPLVRFVCLAAAAAWAAWPALATEPLENRAKDSAPQECPTQGCPLRTCPTLAGPAGECPVKQGAEHLLSKLPYLHRLFGNVGKEGACCDCPSVDSASAPLLPRVWRMVGPDGLERIGVDFDFQLTSGISACNENCTEGKCPVSGCAATRCTAGACAVKTCPARAAGPCPADCNPSLPGKESGEALSCPAFAMGPAQGPFPGAMMGGMPGPMMPGPMLGGPMMHGPMMSGPVALPPPWAMQQPPPAEEGPFFEDLQREAFDRERDLLEKLADARVEAATSQTKLAAQQELAQKEAAFLKQLVAAHFENTKLAAKLEIQAEKEKLASELRQANAELAVLKVQLEVANIKAQLAERKSQEEATASRPAPTAR